MLMSFNNIEAVLKLLTSMIENEKIENEKIVVHEREVSRRVFGQEDAHGNSLRRDACILLLVGAK